MTKATPTRQGVLAGGGGLGVGLLGVGGDGGELGFEEWSSWASRTRGRARINADGVAGGVVEDHLRCAVAVEAVHPLVRRGAEHGCQRELASI